MHGVILLGAAPFVWCGEFDDFGAPRQRRFGAGRPLWTTKTSQVSQLRETGWLLTPSDDEKTPHLPRSHGRFTETVFEAVSKSLWKVHWRWQIGVPSTESASGCLCWASCLPAGALSSSCRRSILRGSAFFCLGTAIQRWSHRRWCLVCRSRRTGIRRRSVPVRLPLHRHRSSPGRDDRVVHLAVADAWLPRAA